MTGDDKVTAGLNQSRVYVDFVVGSADLSVFGGHKDGTEEPIIAKGEWAF